MSKVTISAAQIAALAQRTADAHSVACYASWPACAAALLRHGYTDQQAEEILRSKFMRWAVDGSSAPHGRATARDLLRCLDTCQGETRKLLNAMLEAAA